MLGAAYPFLLAFVLTAVFTRGVMAAAPGLGWVAKPRSDRWHKKPTALMGGIGIFLGTAVSWVVFGDRSSLDVLGLPAALMFVLGVIDDRLTLRPHHKLIGQVVAASLIVTRSVVFEALPMSIAFPLTFAWIIGITNAINLLDNMDGLAGGVGLICALTTAAYCLSQGNPAAAPAVLALAGGCAGFLLWNFPPAKIFMGDCGSMFIGFSLAVLAIQGTHRSAPNMLLSMLVPAGVLAIPILDTLLVSAARTAHGRKISQGGRDHSSHRLVALGLSERNTILVFYALSAGFGVLAHLATQLPLLFVGVAAVLIACGLLVLGLFLGFLRVYPDTERPATDVEGRVLEARFPYHRQLLQAGLDLVLIPACFVGAHLLKFDFAIPQEHKIAVVDALPVVIAAKLLALSVCRGYRGVWRYAGPADAFYATLGSTIGTLLSVCILWAMGRFPGLSRSAIVVDWLLFTMLVRFSRTGYWHLRQLFGLLPAHGATRVLVLGVGEETSAILDRLRDPFSPQRCHVLGILDDNPRTHRRAINGTRVLGPVAELPRLRDEEQVEACILGVPPDSGMGRRLRGYCAMHAVPLYEDAESLPEAEAEPSPARV